MGKELEEEGMGASSPHVAGSAACGMSGYIA